MSFFNPYQNQTPLQPTTGSNATELDGVPLNGTPSNLYDTYMFNNSAGEFQIYTPGNMAFQNSDNVNIGGGFIQADQLLGNPTFGNTATYVYAPLVLGTKTSITSPATTLTVGNLNWPAYLMVHAGTVMRLNSIITASTASGSESILIDPVMYTNSVEYDLNTAPFTIGVADGTITFYVSVCFSQFVTAGIVPHLYCDCEIKGYLETNTTGVPDFYARKGVDITTDFKPLDSNLESYIECSSAGSSATFLGVNANYLWQW